jgi:AraC-like DNA-binding protein
MPPSLACKFTVGELAALRIISDEVYQNGHCDRTLGEIAARAGISRTTAQNALRAAAGLGLLTVQERRRQGQKNLSNVVRIVSKEWLLWIQRGGDRLLTNANLQRPSLASKTIGFKKSDPTDNRFSRRGEIGLPPAPSDPKSQHGYPLDKLKKAIGKAGGR